MFNAAMCSKTKDKMKGFEHVLLNCFFAIFPKFAQYKVPNPGDSFRLWPSYRGSCPPPPVQDMAPKPPYTARVEAPV